MPLPDFAPDSHSAALRRANAARRERSVLLAAIKAGRLSLREVAERRAVHGAGGRRRRRPTIDRSASHE